MTDYMLFFNMKYLVLLALLAPLPNHDLTPGVTNPDIQQSNIEENICNPHWATKSIRPPASYTAKLKRKQIEEYGYEDTNPKHYEEDHLISLELGGNPTDPKNLWPEPWLIPMNAGEKDKVEDYLHAQVCAHNMLLGRAQYLISHDWTVAWKEMQSDQTWTDPHPQWRRPFKGDYPGKG